MEQPNLNYINDLSGDNTEFKQKLLAILKRELPEEIEVYNNAFKNLNYLQAAQSVHKLKHKISILGLEKSYYIAEEYENNLKKNSKDLKDVFETILENMQIFLSDL